MAKLQEAIANTFLEKLRDSPDITPEMVEELRKLLSASKKLKADDLLKIFAPQTGGEVK